VAVLLSDPLELFRAEDRVERGALTDAPLERVELVALELLPDLEVEAPLEFRVDVADFLATLFDSRELRLF